MAQYLLSAFEQFDPISGEVPETANSELSEIAAKARRILGDVSPSQFDSMLEHIRYFVKFGKEFRIKSLKADQSVYVSHGLNMQSFFKGIQNECSIQFSEDPEYYALLALALIGIIVLIEKDPHDSRFTFSIPDLVKEADEALNIGVELSTKGQNTSNDAESRRKILRFG